MRKGAVAQAALSGRRDWRILDACAAAILLRRAFYGALGILLAV
jgi:hypothetical protein